MAYTGIKSLGVFPEVLTRLIVSYTDTYDVSDRSWLDVGDIRAMFAFINRHGRSTPTPTQAKRSGRNSIYTAKSLVRKANRKHTRDMLERKRAAEDLIYMNEIQRINDIRRKHEQASNKESAKLAAYVNHVMAVCPYDYAGYQWSSNCIHIYCTDGKVVKIAISKKSK